ncbi:putative bifunctional diguanylate cyclase/phosphodiesterase [Roseateles oligotrophus]|uniref:GGDEF domain-containing protein n=1 Tax=Roseateles oligotrophus TaxID=1769250 RepID=A0ABT2YMJ6_9BURK|nr:GGDEF domain-containing protein [Roseateles oligotrophus]MCV2371278.1 GGDEF domain-containing protein [Roseateles oligotrophus]
MPFLLPRLRIGPRLALVFSVLLVLLMLVAGMAISRFAHFSSALTTLVSEQALTLELINDISAGSEDAARKLLVLISTKRDNRVRAYTEIDSANQRLNKSMLQLDERLPAGPRREAFVLMRGRLEQYREHYGENVDLLEADDFEEARRMLGGETEASLSSLAEAIRDLSSAAQVAAFDEATRLREQIGRDRNAVLLACLLALILGLGLAAAVTSGITGPLSNTEAGAGLIASGNYAHRISVNANDEVGRVSSAVNTLAQAVGDRERQLQHQANTDLLTGLAQRGHFIRQGDEKLSKLPQGQDSAVLLCLDVDRLKAINNILGFEAGDAVLVGAAGKLQALFNTKRCLGLGRLAGGTFVALLRLPGSNNALEAQTVANEVLQAVQHIVCWQGQTLDLSISIGMALFPEHGQGCEALLRLAEQAMFESKRMRSHASLYVPTLEAARKQQLSLLSDLQEAVAQNQLRQFLQPKVSALDGSLRGVEALVRWQHPVRGWLPPNEFVPFAEHTGRIRQITQWMLERAVRTLSTWHAQGLQLSLAVNVSTLDLQDPGLVGRVASLLKEAELPAHLLHLELTESGLMAAGPEPIQVMHSLHELGVKLSIDDFGTGQSSLAYLQMLPVHELKIDRSFVDGVNFDARRQELLGSIVKLGHSLRLTVTAEGVETEAEMAILRNAGCDLVQGYLVAKPMDTPAFEQWREQYRPAASG